MTKRSRPSEMAEMPLMHLDLFPAAAEAGLAASPAGAEGHRARMRQRLLKAGPDALADHEMLEMILYIALPRRDTKPLAREALRRFQGFNGVIGAPVTELLAIDGLGEAGAAAIKLVQAAMLRAMRYEIVDKPVLASWDRVIAYLNTAMTHERVEQFRVLFLDKRNRLLADEVQGRGTIDRTPAYPREVVRRCLELHATGIILAHNHPSGEPIPSREDVAMTHEINRAAGALGISLVDHIIVGHGKWTSFKQEGLI